MITTFLLAAAQLAPAAAAAAAAPEDIVITAALVPVRADDAASSITSFDRPTITALGATLVTDLVRLSPGVAVAQSGAQGAQTQIRIRGAEATHTLLFIDGIAFNDTAANNEARFETLSADGLGRIEIIRGPQSALWGSEALGGVIAVETPDPLGAARGVAAAEYGSDDFRRGSAVVASGGETAGISATASFARSDGIDILGGGTGDKDGFENYTFSVKGILRPTSDGEIGVVGRYVHHDIEYDGSDPFTFQRADTGDESIAETYAVRGWAQYGLAPDAPWSVRIEAQHFDSENRNSRDGVATNDSLGKRTRIGAQLVHRLPLGTTRHELIARVEREDEDFATRDRQFGGSGDRDLTRGRIAYVGEWRGIWGDLLVTDLAVRHDDYNRFKDETTLRAGAVLKLSPAFALVASYGEGIAQPSFVDLYGFSASSGFIGNPALTPETSRGYEAGVRWTGARASIEAVAFSNALRDEIVEDFSIFPNYTVVNAPGKSRRRGIELSGEWQPAPRFTISGNYTYLDTRERSVAGAASLREVRRPRHTANLYGDWQSGPLTIGGSLAYVGSRRDSDFDLFPSPRVKLGDHVLAGARLAYAITPALEVFGRVENALDEKYQDVVGYRTPGRKVFGGIRVRMGE